MKSLIFAAGLGTRLKPLTDTMPKALVPVDGRPLIRILIEKMLQSGCKEIVINVHHFAKQIIDYIKENNCFGINIQFSDETDKLLETGGGLKKALPLFSSSATPILVHNVDILSNIDLGAFYDSCVAVSIEDPKTNIGAVLLVSERKTSRYLLFDKDDKLVGWTNVTTGQVRSPYSDLDVEKCRKYAFSGIQVFFPHLSEYMNGWDGSFSIIDFYLSVCDKVPILCHVAPELRLLDVGKIDVIEDANRFLRSL
ncbi:MAG: sugar phosphate nucleotidyltransferase [Bacteroides sp.]|nr:sugar phosphate nucleotidyltransferase [Bacteroides sp.]MCM1421211.1 sugar phosphate nucleotidyltransferase [Bacteroides sp.]